MRESVNAKGGANDKRDCRNRFIAITRNETVARAYRGAVVRLRTDPWELNVKRGAGCR